MIDVSATLRQFNRNFTQRIGVLEDRFLGLGRPLGASRLLWEVGHDGRSATDLRNRLDLDSAYLSRLLRQLEKEGLIHTAPDADDRRRRIVRLTQKGQVEWDELEDRSDHLARTLLAPLTDRQQHELADALNTADKLIRAATVEIDVNDPEDPASTRALEAYFAELDERFDTGFDPGDTIVADADDYRRPNGIFLLARSGSETVACGAVYVMEPGMAEIKRMWVDDNWRGLGLGRRMLETLEAKAADLGCGVIRLDTNSALIEAIAMYSTAGYTSIESYNDNPFARCWFEKAL